MKRVTERRRRHRSEIWEWKHGSRSSRSFKAIAWHLPPKTEHAHSQIPGITLSPMTCNKPELFTRTNAQTNHAWDHAGNR